MRALHVKTLDLVLAKTLSCNLLDTLMFALLATMSLGSE